MGVCANLLPNAWCLEELTGGAAMHVHILLLSPCSYVGVCLCVCMHVCFVAARWRSCVCLYICVERVHKELSNWIFIVQVIFFILQLNCIFCCTIKINVKYINIYSKDKMKSLSTSENFKLEKVTFVRLVLVYTIYICISIYKFYPRRNLFFTATYNWTKLESQSNLNAPISNHFPIDLCSPLPFHLIRVNWRLFFK